MQHLVSELLVRNLGRQSYVPVWQAMQNFTDSRNEETKDEVWLVEHDPVFTQGLAGKAEHILMAGDIPVVQVDRGGQVTYHGPGQQVVYFLIDLKRKKLGVRQLVSAIENTVIALLQKYQIKSAARPDAPGVYVEDKKICSLGLKIRRGASFHGLALNVAMDKEPFQRINPCGYAGMQITQVSELGGPKELNQIGEDILLAIKDNLNYSTLINAQNNLAFLNVKSACTK